LVFGNQPPTLVTITPPSVNRDGAANMQQLPIRAGSEIWSGDGKTEVAANQKRKLELSKSEYQVIAHE
jgi:hypothetical protein